MAKRRGRRGRYRLLTPTERAAVVARFREGALVGEVMAEFGLPHTSACHIQDEAALTRRRVLYSPHRLSFEERERIFVGVCRGESDSEIARAPSLEHRARDPPLRGAPAVSAAEGRA